MAETTEPGTGSSGTQPDPGSSGQHPGTSVGIVSDFSKLNDRLDTLLDAVDLMLKRQVAGAKRMRKVIAGLRATDPENPK